NYPGHISELSQQTEETSLLKLMNTTPWPPTQSQQNIYAPSEWDENSSKDSIDGASGWPRTTSTHKTFPALPSFANGSKPSVNSVYKVRKKLHVRQQILRICSKKSVKTTRHMLASQR